jgi:hypothetical protein
MSHSNQVGERAPGADGSVSRCVLLACLWMLETSTHMVTWEYVGSYFGPSNVALPWWHDAQPFATEPTKQHLCQDGFVGPMVASVARGSNLPIPWTPIAWTSMAGQMRHPVRCKYWVQ